MQHIKISVILFSAENFFSKFIKSLTKRKQIKTAKVMLINIKLIIYRLLLICYSWTGNSSLDTFYTHRKWTKWLQNKPLHHVHFHLTRTFSFLIPLSLKIPTTNCIYVRRILRAAGKASFSRDNKTPFQQSTYKFRQLNIWINKDSNLSDSEEEMIRIIKFHIIKGTIGMNWCLAQHKSITKLTYATLSNLIYCRNDSRSFRRRILY